MYISDSLAYQHRPEFQNDNYEHLWADIRVNNKMFAINAMYRPPNESAENHQHFLDTADDILQQLSTYDRAEYKLMSGDLNFGNCYCKIPILNPKPLDASAPDLFSRFGFQQLIDIPTCARNGNSRSIPPCSDGSYTFHPFKYLKEITWFSL